MASKKTSPASGASEIISLRKKALAKLTERAKRDGIATEDLSRWLISELMPRIPDEHRGAIAHAMVAMDRSTLEQRAERLGHYFLGLAERIRNLDQNQLSAAHALVSSATALLDQRNDLRVAARMDLLALLNEAAGAQRKLKPEEYVLRKFSEDYPDYADHLRPEDIRGALQAWNAKRRTTKKQDVKWVALAKFLDRIGLGSSGKKKIAPASLAAEWRRHNSELRSSNPSSD